MHRSRSVVGGLSRGVRKAMELLLEAHEAADEQQMDTWQYALEMNDLRRAGALDHELRMLIGLRWIEHAVEVTGEQEARLSYAGYQSVSNFDGSQLLTQRQLLFNAFYIDLSRYAEVKGFFNKVQTGDEQQAILQNRNAGAQKGN